LFAYLCFISVKIKQLHRGIVIVLSHLIDEVIESGDTFLETLSLSDLVNKNVSLGALFHGITGEHLPMVKYTLRESSS